MCPKFVSQKKLPLKFGQNQVSKHLRYSWYGQMSPGQMLHGQMSPWQLDSVLDGPRKLCLNVGQNWGSNSWDIEMICLGRLYPSFLSLTKEHKTQNTIKHKKKPDWYTQNRAQENTKHNAMQQTKLKRQHKTKTRQRIKEKKS